MSPGGSPPTCRGEDVTVARAVRIRRGTRATHPAPPPVPVRENRAGSRRARRVAATYTGSLSLLTALLAVLDATRPDAGRPGVQDGLDLFLGVAVLLAAASAAYAVTAAPRRVELRPEGWVVVGRWGRRRTWAPGLRIRVEIVRRLPVGMLSPEPVDAVRLSDRTGRSVVYEVGRGLLDGIEGAPSAVTREDPRVHRRPA